ncbi:hypothetical protein [Agarilytica rhodophyticola]|uniref:hypothetical protein n=1 Tax=Agarilytica rhodophyticola TaxID=1737490 RepID=UPI000B34698A|nr:hypothetical protein [Agarilytica rhodophyticola]
MNHLKKMLSLCALIPAVAMMAPQAMASNGSVTYVCEEVAEVDPFLRLTVTFDVNDIMDIRARQTNTRLKVEEVERTSQSSQIVLEDEGDNWIAQSFRYRAGNDGVGRFVSFYSRNPLGDLAKNMTIVVDGNVELNEEKIVSWGNNRRVTNILWASCQQQ